jgi:hypothetical protein
VDYTVCRPVAAVWSISVPFGKNTLAVDRLHNSTLFHRTSYTTALPKVDWRSCTLVIVFGFERINFVAGSTRYFDTPISRNKNLFGTPISRDKNLKDL